MMGTKGSNGATCDGSPKVVNYSPLVSHSTTINVPRKPNSVDVATTFRVPLITVGALHKLINDIEAVKHDELLSEMTNDDRMETMDALGTICNSIQADNINADVTTAFLDVEYYARNNLAKHGLKRIMMNSKGFFFFKFDSRAGLEAVVESGPWLIHDGISLISTFIGKPVMLDSYTSTMCNDSWVRSKVSCCLIKVNSEADLVNVVTIGIPSLYGDGFTKETIRVEYEWRPPRFYSGPLVKQNVRYEPKADTSTPKKEVTNVSNASQSSSMLKMTGKSSKKDNLSMSNSFSALNDEEDDDEEDVENVYDKSANLIQNTKAGGSLYFTAAVG
nr:hypothetical protein [Tanacetum cinerariifolium]